MDAETAAPMLRLLERLAGHVLAARAETGGALTCERLALRADGVELEVAARHVTWLLDGHYRLDARILRTDPEETRCTVRLAEGRTAGRVAGAALALLPDRWVNPLLERWLPGLRRDGHELVLSHRAFARALLERHLV